MAIAEIKWKLVKDTYFFDTTTCYLSENGNHLFYSGNEKRIETLIDNLNELVRKGCAVWLKLGEYEFALDKLSKCPTTTWYGIHQMLYSLEPWGVMKESKKLARKSIKESVPFTKIIWYDDFLSQEMANLIRDKFDVSVSYFSDFDEGIYGIRIKTSDYNSKILNFIKKKVGDVSVLEESKKSLDESENFVNYIAVYDEDSNCRGYIQNESPKLTQDVEKALHFKNENEANTFRAKLIKRGSFNGDELYIEGMYLNESKKSSKKSISLETLRNEERMILEMIDSLKDNKKFNPYEGKYVICCDFFTDKIEFYYLGDDVVSHRDIVVGYCDSLKDVNLIINELSNKFKFFESKESARKSIKESADDNWYKLKVLNEILDAMAKDEYNIPKLGIYGVTKNIDLDEGAIRALIKYYK